MSAVFCLINIYLLIFTKEILEGQKRTKKTGFHREQWNGKDREGWGGSKLLIIYICNTVL